MTDDFESELYPKPSPYEVLGLTHGPASTNDEIGVAYNRAMSKLKLLRDKKQKAQRSEEVSRAKEHLLHPDNRVLIDFFILSRNVYGDLATTVAQRLSETPLPIQTVLGRLMPKKKFDDLVPDRIERFQGQFPDAVELTYSEVFKSSEPRLALVEITV